MASPLSVGKSKILGLALQQVLGEEPSYIYEDNYVSIYYEPDKLKRVQDKIELMTSSGPSDVRIDFLPMVMPLAIKKTAPYIVGLVLAGILIGRFTR